MEAKPLIGVTGPDRGGWLAWKMTALALYRSGARARRITAAGPCDPSELDGLVIGGGTDVDPFHYGEAPPESRSSENGGHTGIIDWLVGLLLSVLRVVFASHQRQGYDPERDHLEQHLIRYALYNDLPILGICRGAQLMNIALGGSLYQRITHFYTEDTGNVRSILPRKTVDILEGSRLNEALATVHCRVNALHDQSIKELGDQIIVCAKESSGVVQAIERQGHPYFIGVQWHPEYMPQIPRQQALFRKLVEQARYPHSRAVN